MQLLLNIPFLTPHLYFNIARFKNMVILHTLYDIKYCAFVPGVSRTCEGSLFYCVHSC